MPGYDKTRFIDVSEHELHEYTCGICLEIFNDPVFSVCCGQTYCTDCINNWLNEHNTCPNDRQELSTSQLVRPPKAFVNLLNNLRLECEFHSIGCKKSVKLNDLSSHLQLCSYNPKNNCQTCGLVIGDQHNCILNLKSQLELRTDEIQRLKEEISTLKSMPNELPINDSTDRTFKSIKLELPIDIQQNAIKYAKEALDNWQPFDKSAAIYIKKLLDDNYGGRWCCFIYSNYQGCSYVSHIPDRYLHFVLGANNIVIFQTQEQE